MVSTKLPSAIRSASFPDTGYGSMALVIVLRRDRNQDLSHEQCLLASFLHMAELVEKSHSKEWGQDWQTPWESWKGGKFRKIVKRANPQRFDSLAEDPQAIVSSVQIGNETVQLLSFPPYYLSDPDTRVKPLQVAGLDYEAQGPYLLEASTVSTEEPDAAESTAPRKGLVLAYDGSLGATTGKMMAQAAHAAQMMKLKEPSWSAGQESLLIVEGFAVEGVEWLVQVVDSGFTEVAPNSTTVKLGRFVD